MVYPKSVVVSLLSLEHNPNLKQVSDGKRSNDRTGGREQTRGSGAPIGKRGGDNRGITVLITG